MSLKRHGFFLFWLLTSVLYAAVFITMEFAGSPFSGVRGFAVIAMQWMCVSVAAGGVLMLMAANRWIFAVTWPPFMLLSAVVAYYKCTFGVSLTAQSVELAMVNTLGTWATVIDGRLVAACAASVLVSLGWVWIRFRVIRCRRPWLWAVTGLLTLMVPTVFVDRLKGPVSERMPVAIYSAFSQYVENRGEIASVRDAFNGVPAEAGADSLTVVFVIGESLRADHLQINGYHRRTTPYLVQEENVVSFPHVRTIPYFTHTSVPYIMSRADSVNQTAGYTEPSFITLFKKAGFHTSWLSNQDSGFAYIYFMHEADTLCNLDTGRSAYSFDAWLDRDMLPHFSRLLGEGGSRKLVVMHAIGSHWWYPTHYTEEQAVFKPEVRSRVLSEVTAEEMVNSYDNTIVATDEFLHEVMDGLRDLTAVLVFISDHGEALGEDGRFLHADDYPQLHNPACVVWWSPSYGARFPDRVAALRANAGKPFLTDALFHTALDAAVISTPVLKPAESLMNR